MTIVIGDPTPSRSTGPATQAAALILNGLDLMMTEPAAEGYVIHASADGTTWGDPEAVIASIESQLSDGDLESLDRYGNRTATIALAIEAPDSSAPGRAVALGQRALELACRWPGGQVRELAWTSPMAGAETTVTEMTTAVVSRSTEDDWDLEEKLRGTRLFSLTIHARPFVRGTTPVTIEAPAVIGSTTTTVDDGSSTSGWSIVPSTPLPPMRNLETNPTVTGLNGWTAGSGASSLAYVSSPSGHLRVGSSAAKGARVHVNSPAYAVTAGKRYVFGVEMELTGNVPAGSYYVGILVRWYSDAAATSQVGSDAIYRKVFIEGQDGPVLTPVLTAPAGAVRARYFPYATAPGGSYSDMYRIYGRWVVEDAIAQNVDWYVSDPYWFSGDTPDTPALTFSWDGPANASTSTATWTTPTLAASGGLVVGTQYGRSNIEMDRTNSGIAAAQMASLPYLRIKGTMAGFGVGTPSMIVYDGDTALVPWSSIVSYSGSSETGSYEVIVHRPGGFAGSLRLWAGRGDQEVSTTEGLILRVDSVELTDNPVGSGKVQSRQVQIYGSQRTELSLLVRGLGAAGTAPVGLGPQTLVFTCAADDTRAKYASARRTSGASGTADSTATSGFYNAGAAKTGSPTGFNLGSGATLLPGTYDIYASVYITTAGTHTISVRVDRDAGIGAPITGAWQDVDVTAVSSGAVWPQLPTGSWRLIPVGTFTVAEADASSITLTPAASTADQVRFDDLLVFHRTRGQLSLVDTSASSGSLSALRLDAATTTNPLPSVWVGVAGGAMMPADMTGRCQATEQHQAEPGVLQVVTITPGCDTTRVSASYYERYAFDYVTTAPRSVAA